MSRGHGSKQQQILRHVRKAGDLAVNELQWIVNGLNNDISASFANSFGRALDTLEEEGSVIIRRRRLSSFDEVVRLFPFRSRSRQILGLRQRLLPHLQGYKPPRGGYGRAENERFVLERVNELRWRDDRFSEIEREWKRIEDGLLRLMPSKAAPHALLVDTITRGRQLFSFASGFASPHPLDGLLKRLLQMYAGRKRPAVVDQLFHFYQRLIPRENRIAAGVLSKVLDVVDIARNGADHIREDAVAHLLRSDLKFVTSLPDYQPAVHRSLGKFNIPWGPPKCPLLDKLVTKEALREFRFVTATRCG